MLVGLLLLALAGLLVVGPWWWHVRRGGPRVSLQLGDTSMGVAHDFGDGLRRINLPSPLDAQMARDALSAEGVEVTVGGASGGMMGGLDGAAHIVYATDVEDEVNDVVRELGVDGGWIEGDR